MRRLPRATWIGIVTTGILTAVGGAMANIGVPALSWLSPPVALTLFLLISLILVGMSLRHETQTGEIQPSEIIARRNRQIMLDRVQAQCNTGLLKSPLYNDKKLLPSVMRTQVPRFDLMLSDPLNPAQPLPPGTTIQQVFERAKGELLLLGEAGSGKTTLLLELAQAAIEHARCDEEAPLPVILTLSSWAIRQEPLEQWVLKELRLKYQVNHRIGQQWMNRDQLFLLLDGLDEVAPAARAACMKAINMHRYPTHRLLVVCSQTNEYLEHAERLPIQTAVTIQPLSPQQIDTYLSSLGEEMDGLQSILQRSEGGALQALVETPLMLKLLAFVASDKSEEELLPLTRLKPDEQQHALFRDYVERMLQSPGRHLQASSQQMKRWLTWLARQLTVLHQNELYLERLQLDWLTGRLQISYRLSAAFFYALVSGLVGWLFFGITFGPIGRLIAGLIFGLVGGIYILLMPDEQPADVSTWSKMGHLGGTYIRMLIGEKSEDILRYTKMGLFDVVLFVMIFKPFSRQVQNGDEALGGGLWVIFGLIFGLGLWLSGVLSPKQLARRSLLSPNEGIQRSLKSGLLGGLIGGLLGGLLGELDGWLVSFRLTNQISALSYGIFFGLYIGLRFGQGFGWNAVIKQYATLFWLWRARYIPVPWRFVDFLDAAVEQQLLRKVGGGYIFRHRLLQDYFASLDETNNTS